MHKFVFGAMLNESFNRAGGDTRSVNNLVVPQLMPRTAPVTPVGFFCFQYISIMIEFGVYKLYQSGELNT